ncbi:MAG: TRIC cation channel family protein [Chthoniobacterales bacterium]
MITSAESAHIMPIWLEVSAMCISGFFGGEVAAKRGAPILGVLIGGLIFGLGGGVVRDLMLNVMPAAIANWYLLPAVGLAVLLGGACSRFISQTGLPILWIQALALGMLVLIGCDKASHFGISVYAVVAMGVITAMAGGSILDVLSGTRAALLNQGAWHLTSLVAGAVCFVILEHFNLPALAGIGTVITVVASRLISAHLGWQCPEFPKGNSENP